jgi:hypothetical protein
MKTNPFTDTFWFLLGQTDDHHITRFQYPLTIFFAALLIAGIVIAYANWQADEGQRTQEHLWTAFMRIMIGGMWFQGSLWKLPLPNSDGLRYWTSQEVQYAAFGWHKWLAQNVFLGFFQVLDPIVYLTETGLAVSLILGFFVRPMAAIGILFTAQLWLGLYQHPGEWPWEYVFLMFVLAFFAMHNAGRSLGLDALIKRAPFGPFEGGGAIARFTRWAV